MPAIACGVFSNAPGICLMLFGGYACAVPLNRIVVDDRLQHERVVGIDPERLLLIVAPLSDTPDATAGELSDAT